MVGYSTKRKLISFVGQLARQLDNRNYLSKGTHQPKENVMKNKLMTIAIALALVILLARVFEKPLLAQTPTLTQNVDEPGRNPFQLSANMNLAPEQGTSFTVPAGRRYVIESYSAKCLLAPNESMTNVSIRTFVAGQTAIMFAPAFLLDETSQFRDYGATGISRLYADPGTTITMSVGTIGGRSTLPCEFSVVGHVIDLFTIKTP